MSKQIYRNGKLETVSDAEWRRTEKARLERAAANQEAERTLVDKVESKNGKTVVTTRDGRKHQVKGIGSISGQIANLIVGGSGPVHTGSGDQVVNGKKTPKKPKRNPWF